MTQVPRLYETEVVRTLRLNYLLFLPRNCKSEAKKKWPLILFLHGGGQRGTDLELVKAHGIPKIVEQHPNFPFVVVSPQCPPNTWWWLELDGLTHLLDHIVGKLPIDDKRIYLTGLSMGGYGTWHLATALPDRFAAIAPVCGGGLWHRWVPEEVCALKNVPVWAFHGAKDATVPVAESQKMVSALRRCGGSARLTVYPDAAHDSWTRTYENPELYEWFLEHSLPEFVP